MLGLLPSKFAIDATVLNSLTSVNNETIAVALFAGAAGMLALEMRALTAVAVAISATTIPAAAYLGVAIGIGDLAKAPGAVAVLGMNVLMMSTGAATALLVQRRRFSGGGDSRRSGDVRRPEAWQADRA